MNTDLDEKQESVRGRIYRYSTSWIHGLETEKHWRHYWYQQKIMQGLVVPGDHVLEIGIGTGFTANYLKSKDVKVTTLDIDREKKPDIHANIVSYHFDQVFDHILAFEVFEHIPFEEVEKLVPRLTKSCQKYFFTSVPRNEVTWCRLEFWLPRLKQRVLHLAARKGRINDPHHYWEMDWKGITKQKFNMLFSEAGFEMLLQKKHWSLIYSVYKSH
jgi:hypothetical protein